MSDRNTILSAVRTAIAPLKERTPYPEYDTAIATMIQSQTFATDWDLFAHRLKAVSGVPLVGLEALAAYLTEQKVTHGYCDPVWVDRIGPLCPGITFDTNFDRNNPDSYAFGITKASGAIAATGTVILKDSETSSRLAALAPWIHIALLERKSLLPSIAVAISQFGNDPAIILVTGPSKTADVEGILIEGVHGPGIQIVVLVD